MVTTRETFTEGEQTQSHAGLYAALVAFALFMLIAGGAWALYQRAGGSAALDRKGHNVLLVTPGMRARETAGKIEMAAFFQNQKHVSHAEDLRHAEGVA